MSPMSGGASGPASQTALGLRFEFYDEDGRMIATIVREDIKGAAVPRQGEHIGTGSLSPLVHGLVGESPAVDHLEHFLRVPGTRDWAPLTMVVARVRAVESAQLRQAQEALDVEGWTVFHHGDDAA
ncbi:hypothetical protein ACFUTX_01070 [Microbacterium sp. NPDC057407]|uniref:hypothetical protein n=1 Tax=Microbacterium sp. NPDC057407 TaxID=3346120 RepID=UPI00366BB2AB